MFCLLFVFLFWIFGFYFSVFPYILCIFHTYWICDVCAFLPDPFQLLLCWNLWQTVKMNFDDRYEYVWCWLYQCDTIKHVTHLLTHFKAPRLMRKKCQLHKAITSARMCTRRMISFWPRSPKHLFALYKMFSLLAY